MFFIMQNKDETDTSDKNQSSGKRMLLKVECHAVKNDDIQETHV
jgi:hypothetical protein